MVPPPGWLSRIRGALTGRRESGPQPGTKTLCLFGQSHVACLHRAYKFGRYRPASKSIALKFVLTDKNLFPNDELIHIVGGEDTIHPNLAEAFRDHHVLSGSGEVWLISVVRGNDFNFVGLLEPEPAFDFVHPSLPDLPLRSDALLLPYDAVRDQFRRKADIARRFYQCLPRQGVTGVLHIEGPPPIPLERQIRRAVDTKFLIKMHARAKDVRISAPEFRLKLWKCQSDAMREVCAETNVVYVTPPEETIDADGYLKPRAWHGATHGSSWYGGAVMRKIEAVVNGTQEPGK